MLDYLERLCAALLARSPEEILRLLRHPLARTLPRRVREEAYGIAAASSASLRAPVHALHLYQQTIHLLADAGATGPGYTAPAVEPCGELQRRLARLGELVPASEESEERETTRFVPSAPDMPTRWREQIELPLPAIVEG